MAIHSPRAEEPEPTAVAKAPFAVAVMVGFVVLVYVVTIVKLKGG